MLRSTFAACYKAGVAALLFQIISYNFARINLNTGI